jgi:RNA ligase (TIGR02306 family)
MERKLASIQRIKKVEPIENADAIEKVSVLGWHCVARKGEFKEGDLCVYCEIDSLLPEGKPDFEFLRASSFIDKNDQRGFRIRTVKLRGQVSQGICFPLSILKTPVKEGDDTTSLLGITKYEPPIPVNMRGITKGRFPPYIPKTDETRIQSVPDVLTRNKGVECYVTEKLDGCSMTAWKEDGELNIASRGLWLKETEENIYWIVANKLGLKYKFLEGIVIQGELIGEGIQGNRYGLKGHDIRWFNVYSLAENKYADYSQAESIIGKMGLSFVPVLTIIQLGYMDIDALVDFSKYKSTLAQVNQEGIVIRSIVEKTDVELGRLSFKVVNPDYLLKYTE